MKLRIRGNSVRLRLTQSEVEALAKDAFVEERTELVGNTFSYALKIEDGAMRASFENGILTVSVPTNEAQEWVSSDRVEMEGISGHVRILVEKDFACVTPRGEEDVDAFPNPNEVC